MGVPDRQAEAADRHMEAHQQIHMRDNGPYKRQRPAGTDLQPAPMSHEPPECLGETGRCAVRDTASF